MAVQNIIDKVSNELKEIPGVVGVVLGGSRARGTHSKLLTLISVFIMMKLKDLMWLKSVKWLLS